MRTMHAWWTLGALCSLVAFQAACVDSSQSAATSPAYGPGYYSHGPAGSGGQAATEGYRSRSPRMRAGGILKLPGLAQRQLVKYDLVDGMAIMQGDIMLGPMSMLPLRYGLALTPTDPSTKYAVAISNNSHLWPNAVIPYEIDGSNSSSTVQSIQWAIAELNKTQLKLRPRSAADQDYVVFSDTGNGCTSYVGRIGGGQTVSTSGCSRGSLAHEILHAAGFYHEQSRADRDNFVAIMWDEITAGYEDNFQTQIGSSVDIGVYDYGSIMHYDALAFSKSGRPTIVVKTANAQIGQRDGLSPLDRSAIAQLYGSGGPAPVPGPTVPQPGQPPSRPTNGSFSGNYISQQGNLSCSQNGAAVQCSFPAGTLWCTAAGDDLNCGWTGSGGQGRAAFRRQPSGVVAGTWGDGFSANSRGAWDLTPDASAPAPAQPVPTSPFPLPWPTGSGALPIPLPLPSAQLPAWPR